LIANAGKTETGRMGIPDFSVMTKKATLTTDSDVDRDQTLVSWL
jgi:hypothetical protein